MNIISEATTRERLYRCVRFAQRAALLLAPNATKQVKLKFRRIHNVLILIILSIPHLYADDLKTVPQQAEVIQPESDKKENANGKFQMAVSIDNEFTSNIAKDISDLQDKLKKSAKETVNESMQTVKSSIIEIVKEAAGAMPKTEVVVALPTPIPTPMPTPEKAPRLVANDIREAKRLAKKFNKKLIVFYGDLLCCASKDIFIALERGYINPGEEYIIATMDPKTGAKQIKDLIEFYRKQKPGLFRTGNVIMPPYVFIETPDEKILSAKHYTWGPNDPRGNPISLIKEDLNKYRYK